MSSSNLSTYQRFSKAPGVDNLKLIRAVGMQSEDCTPDTPGFPLFSKLSPELRKIIWALALPGRRHILIEAATYTIPATDNKPTKTIPIVKIKQDRILLAMLSACPESRATALENFTLAFDEPYKKPRFHNPVYINWEKDTLLVDGEEALAGLCRGNTPNTARFVYFWQKDVRHMSILGNPAWISEWWIDNKWLLHSLQNLKTLTLETYLDKDGMDIFKQHRKRTIYNASRYMIRWPGLVVNDLAENGLNIEYINDESQEEGEKEGEGKTKEVEENNINSRKRKFEVHPLFRKRVRFVQEGSLRWAMMHQELRDSAAKVFDLTD